jgi:4-hydroxy-tetrahydrodipicolinate synthase
MTLPLLSVGGVGIVGTSTHFTGRRTRDMIETFLAGDTAKATALNAALLPVYLAVFATQGCMLVKAGLAARGFAPGPVRKPLLDASPEQAATFLSVLAGNGF